MSLIVTSSLVIAKRADGSDVYLYEGASFPDGMLEGEAERLADFLGSPEIAPDAEPEPDVEPDAEPEPTKPARRTRAAK